MKIKRDENSKIESENKKNDIAKQILNILEINNNNNKFILKDLDNNKEKQEEIISLIPQIRQVYTQSQMPFLNPSKKRNRLFLSILRQILRERNYIIVNKDINLKDENGFKDFNLISMISFN